MSQKYLNNVHKLSSKGLRDLLKKNGYEEFEEVLTEKGVDGATFLKLTEFEIARWRLSHILKKRLWSCLVTLKDRPQTFFRQEPPEIRSKIVARNPSFNDHQSAIKKKLEAVILTTPESVSRFNAAPKRPSPSRDSVGENEASEDYLVMDKPKNSNNLKDRYDENDYLVPTPASEDAENEYEPPPSVKKAPARLPGDKRTPGGAARTSPAAQRKPMVLPRSPDQDYLNDSELGLKDGDEYEPPPSARKRGDSFKGRRLVLPAPTPPRSASPKITVQDEEAGDYEPPPAHGGGRQAPTLLSRNTTIRSPQTDRKNPHTYENAEIADAFKRRLKKLFKKSSGEEAKAYVNLEDVAARSREEKLSTLVNRPLPPTPDEEPAIVVSINQNFDDMIDSINELIYENNPNAATPDGSESNRRKGGKLPKPASSALPEPPMEAKSSTQNEAIYGNAPEDVPPEKPKSFEHLRRNFDAEKPDNKKLPHPPSRMVLPPAFTDMADEEEQQDEECEDYDNCIFNLNNEPFYRNTDRKGARQLLQYLEDGAFLFRPSKRYFLTLTVKYKKKFFNLGIEKTPNDMIRCHSEGSSTSPEFATIGDFIECFSREVLTFKHEASIVEIYLKKALPSHVF